MKTTMKVTAFGAMMLSCATAFGALRAVTPTAWDGDPNCWQMKRHNEKMAVVTNGGAQVVFIGDSITHFWESCGAEQLKRYFSEGRMKMLDLGISGDRTEHVLWRLTEGKELDGYEAKVILLMIGTNNSGHFSFSDEPPTDAILGIRQILDVIVRKQPKATVVLTAIFPRGTDANDSWRKRNDVVNREIQRFADGRHIFWCDFSDDLLTVDGRLSPEIFPDLLHPNGFGYEIWYSAVRPYIDYAFSDGRLAAPGNRYARPRAGALRLTEPLALFPCSRVGEAWWRDRLLQKRNQIADAKGEIDLVFFGDSITHHWETSGKDTLAELRKTYSVLDIGYGGDRTEHLLWRGENGELDGYKAKCVMLLIGCNNTWHRMDRPEDTAEGIRRILAVIARKQPQAKTLLLPVFPFGDKPTDEKRVNNEKVNKIIRAYADGKKVIWVDFNAKFLDEKGDTVKWMPDHCHPNAEAYKTIWLPAALPHFREIVGK